MKWKRNMSHAILIVCKLLILLKIFTHSLTRWQCFILTMQWWWSVKLYTRDECDNDNEHY